MLGLLFKSHTFDPSIPSSDWNPNAENKALKLENVWRPSTVLGVDDLSARFGVSMTDLPAESGQWPSAELSNAMIRSELEICFGKAFAENYRQLLSTYASAKFEREVGTQFDVIHSFLQAKHEYDNNLISRSGTLVLAELQKRLQPSKLKRCSPRHGRALFLVLLATIFAAGKTRREACGADDVR
jgi:hypothetical protein